MTNRLLLNFNSVMFYSILARLMMDCAKYYSGQDIVKEYISVVLVMFFAISAVYYFFEGVFFLASLEISRKSSTNR